MAQTILQQLQRVLAGPIEKDALVARGRLLAITPHQVRAIDALLAGMAQAAQHPGQRRTVGSSHVGLLDHLAKGRVLTSRHH